MSAEAIKLLCEGIRHELASVRQEAARARDEALEEAAQVAEALDPEKPSNYLNRRERIASAIRALKTAAQKEGEK